MRQHTAGFTMVELVVMLLVMGVMAAIAIPRFSDRNGINEMGFRDQLAAMLRQARKTASMRQNDVCVVINPVLATASAVFTTNAVCDTSRPVPEPGGSQPFAIDIPNGVTVGGALQLRFAPDGRPVPDLTRVVTVGNRSVTVSQETGLVY
jgi:MSHA pilin protein MshC